MKFRLLSGLAISVVLLQSCSNHIMLANHTALGVDVTNENGANAVIGFKRSELANVPRKEDGTAHSTIMRLDNEYDFQSSYCVSQQIATGYAADVGAIALSTDSDVEINIDDYSTSGENDNATHDPLVFYSYTSWGLGDLNLSASNPQNSVSLFHFKRSEGAIIPVEENEEVRSIYGEFFLQDKEGDDEPTKHVQTMATGKAAIQYATNRDNWNLINCD